MTDPLRSELRIRTGSSPDADQVRRTVRRAIGGPVDLSCTPPAWLYEHQRVAYRRARSILAAFGGCILADAVGLGKTYVALALALSYRRVTVVAPAALVSQWSDAGAARLCPLKIVSTESLSRGRVPPAADLLVVDESHRFRNTSTVRYDRLARSVGHAHVLLLTATPIVNHLSDIVALLLVFLPDHGLALHGVPSLAGVMKDAGALSAAIRSLTITRTWRTAPLAPTALPQIADEPVVRLGPVRRTHLATIVSFVDTLGFPVFDRNHTASCLLAGHLVHRLSSSAEAALETLHRHRAFLRRALAAAHRGEVLTRARARYLFSGWDDHQLDLLDGLHVAHDRVATDDLHDELLRLEYLIGLVTEAAATSPKRDHLFRLLERRRDRQTLVFTSSVATALALARHGQWKQLAVATGRGARVASGSTDLQTVLDLFAPRARGVRAPGRQEVIRTLIATDLVSEGLNLQDADGIVHYDLPWTPLRLQQRLGRIARLGSQHPVARTWWFAPPAVLERRLELTNRILRKAQLEQSVSSATSSTIGVGRQEGGVGEERERLAVFDRWPVGQGAMVVRGNRAVVFALEWTVRGESVPELLVMENDAWVPALKDQLRVAAGLLEGAPSDRPVDVAPYEEQLTVLLKTRLSGSRAGPVDPDTRRLVRAVIALARQVGKLRQRQRLVILDSTLARLTAGVTPGGLRGLESALQGPDWGALSQWCTQWPLRRTELSRPRLRAVIVGDETLLSHCSIMI